MDSTPTQLAKKFKSSEISMLFSLFVQDRRKKEKQMRRITQVISDSNLGGAGVLVCHICEALKEDFDFTLMLPTGSALISRVPRGVRVREVAMARDRSFRPSDVALFRRLFNSEKPDLVHTHATLSARIGARLCGIKPILSTRHCSVEKGKNASVLKKNYVTS